VPDATAKATAREYHPLFIVIMFNTAPGAVELTDDGLIVWYGENEEKVR
jgi:hypothetical protein